MSNNKPDLSDARAKLDRATIHIGQIKGEIAAFLNTDFYQLTLEHDKREGRIKINCQFFGFKPPSSDGKRL